MKRFVSGKTCSCEYDRTSWTTERGRSDSSQSENYGSITTEAPLLLQVQNAHKKIAVPVRETGEVVLVAMKTSGSKSGRRGGRVLVECVVYVELFIHKILLFFFAIGLLRNSSTCRRVSRSITSILLI